jgi:hypothetical protein
MKKDYVPPIVIKSKKMDFPIAIINSSGKGIVCKQCSSCHTCR